MLDVNIKLLETSTSKQSICKHRDILAFSFYIVLESKEFLLNSELLLINMCYWVDMNINSLHLSLSLINISWPALQ